MKIIARNFNASIFLIPTSSSLPLIAVVILVVVVISLHCTVMGVELLHFCFYCRFCSLVYNRFQAFCSLERHRDITIFFTFLTLFISTPPLAP
jgi:hypothetical protein